MKPENWTLIRRAFREIFQEFMMRMPGYEDQCAAKLMEILVSLGRSVSGRIVTSNRFAELLGYIHSHFTEKLCIAELAASEHLSVSRFRDVFHNTFGCSPMEYIMDLRIRYAQDLLIDTNLSIGEISQLCGYSDALYFMRLFQKKNGVSAMTYRKHFGEQ